ncbi:MAG: TrmB family transcriptional regulator sugar-binding domain-containing protein [Halorhabdus sp.]
MGTDGRLHESTADVLESIRTRVRNARREVALSLPVDHYPAVRPVLETARDRDVFVLLLVHSFPGHQPDPDRFADAASIVRWTSEQGQVFCTADKEWAIDGHRLNFDGERTIEDVYRYGTTVHNRMIAQALYGYMIADDWSVADELVVFEPADPPVTFENFRRAVVEATLRLRAGRPIEMTADLTAIPDGERTTATGRIVNARQTLVYPISSTFPSEHSLFVDLGGERVSLGGLGSYAEDYECHEITFERLLDPSS